MISILKLFTLILFIPFTLFGSHSLHLDWSNVPEEQNGLKLLAAIHKQAGSLENAEFYDIIRKYEDEGEWDETEAARLIAGASQIEKEVKKALEHDIWQVDGFYAPDTLSKELNVFQLWRAVQRIRFYDNLIEGKPEEAYANCKDLSDSGLKIMGAKGGTRHFIAGFSAYSDGLEFLSKLESAYPNFDFSYFGVPTSVIRRFYRDTIRHEYGSALNLVDYLVKQLKEEGHDLESALIQVKTTKGLITEVYQEALDNSFLETSEYNTQKRERIESLVEERLLPENAKNAAGLKLLALLNWHPESIWEYVIKHEIKRDERHHQSN